MSGMAKKIPNHIYPALMFALLLMVTAPIGYFLTIFLKENLGFSGSQIGFLYSLGAFTGVLCSIPAGLINDRLKSVTILTISALLMAAGYGGMAIFTSYALYVWLYFIMSLAVATFKLSLDVAVLKGNNGPQSAANVASYHAFRYVGQAIGTFLSGYLLAIINFQYFLLAVAALSLLFIPMALKLPSVTIDKVTLRDYVVELKNPKAIFMAIWVFIFTLHWGAEYTCYGLFLHHTLALTYEQMGLYMGVELVVLTITVLLAMKYIDRAGMMNKFILLGLFLSGSSLIGMTFTPIALSLFFRAIHGVGDGLVFLVLFMGLVRLFEPERLGGVTGFFNFVQMAGTIVGSIISGYIGDRFGWGVPFWSSGILCLILILFVFICGRKGLLAEHEYENI